MCKALSAFAPVGLVCGMMEWKRGKPERMEYVCHTQSKIYPLFIRIKRILFILKVLSFIQRRLTALILAWNASGTTTF